MGVALGVSSLVVQLAQTILDGSLAGHLCDPRGVDEFHVSWVLENALPIQHKQTCAQSKSICQHGLMGQASLTLGKATWLWSEHNQEQRRKGMSG